MGPATVRRPSSRVSRTPSIEILESRIAPAFGGSYSGPINDRTLTLSGSLSGEDANLSLSDPNTLRLVNVGGSTLLFDLTGVTEIRMLGFGGQDDITINLSGGAIATATRPFEFDGTGAGGLGSSLAVLGAGTPSAGVQLGANGAGVITINSGAYAFSGIVSWLSLSNFNALAVKAPDGPNDFVFAGSAFTSQTHLVSFASIPNISLDLGGTDPFGDADKLAVVAQSGLTVATASLSVSLGVDIDELRFSIAAGVTTLNAINFDGGMGADTLVFTRDGNQTLSNSALSFDIGSVSLAAFEIANLTGGTGADSFNVSAWTHSGLIDGAGGTDTLVATHDVASLTLSAATLARTGMGTLILTALETATITGGAGANNINIGNWAGLATVDGAGGTDTLNSSGDFASTTIAPSLITRSSAGNVSFSNFENHILTGGGSFNSFNISNWLTALTIDGGGGTDTLVATNDVAYLTLSNTRFERPGAANITLSNMEAATLTGGAGVNAFFMSGWAGSATINGAGGTDRLFSEENIATFTLSSTSLARSGLGTFTYSGIEDVDLIGGASANTFLISGSVTGVSFDGRGGTDIVSATDDVTAFVLSDSQLARTGRATIDLFSIESALLTGGAGGNTFTVTDWSGTGTLDGAGGSDAISATNDVAAFTLGNAQLARSGRGTLALVALESANLTGGALDTTFDVLDWAGGGTLDGGAGMNSLAVTGDAAAVGLTNTQLTRSGTGVLSLSNVAVATLTGGPAANAFTISGWTGPATVNGAGGADSLVALNDVASFVLTNTKLSRAGMTDVTLISVEAATLTGGASANSFDVSGWTRAGTLDGAGGTDVLLATSDAAAIGLANAQLTRTGSGILTLANLEVANLSGGVANQTFDVSSWSGAGTIDGGEGPDTIASTNDVAAFILSNSSLSRTGRPDLLLAGFEDALLAGGAAANAFTVSDWSGRAVLDGLSGTDALIATNNTAYFDLSDSALSRSGFGEITLAGIESATLTGGVFANAFIVSDWSGSATIDGAGHDEDLVLASNDIASFALTDSLLTRSGRGSVALAGVERAALTGGASVNTFTVSGWTGAGTLDGAGGDDVLIAAGAGEYVLSDSRLARASRGDIGLISVEVASLQGGIDHDAFTVSDWTGSGTLDGAGGSDTFVAISDVAAFVLTDAQFSRSGRGNIALAAIEVALLAGGSSANSFTVSGWTGSGALDGAGGADTVIAINDVATFALADSGIARSGHGALTLANVEVAQLTGGASANQFIVSGWSKSGTIDGAGGDDSIFAEHDLAQVVLSNAALSRTGRGDLSLISLESATLIGGAGANVFNVSGWTSHVSIDGLGGVDAITAANDVATFELSDAQLLRPGFAPVTLVSVESANLTGSASANTFDLSGWSGGGALQGGGGTDTITATDDAEQFVLSDSQFARSGRGAVALSSIELASLIGGASANTFIVSAWTGDASVDGLNGIDTISATTDAGTIALSDAQLTRSGLGIITLARVESAALAGGALANAFTVANFTGAATLSGLGEKDTFTLNPGSGLITVLGGSDDDLVVLTGDVQFSIDGGSGEDTLRLNTAGYALELPGIADHLLQGIEITDVRGTGNNSLVLDLAEVLNLSPESDTLLVRNDPADPVIIGDGWSFDGTETIAGISYAVFTQAAAILKVENAAPFVFIEDASVAEGANGMTALTFTVTRGGASLGASSLVSFAASGGTATANVDFKKIAGAVVFAPGEVTQTITIEVIGDARAELDESFTVSLLSSSGAVITRGTAVGTILNDDAAVIVSADRKSATYLDVDGDTVLVRTSKPVLDPGDFTFGIIPGSASGVQLQAIDLSNIGAAGSGTTLSISARPSALGGNGLVNVGSIHALGAVLGSVRIAGDLGRIDAGSGNPGSNAVKSLAVHSLGSLGVDTQGAGGNLNSQLEGSLPKLTVKTDARGASITTTGAIGNVTILNSMIGGTIAAGTNLGVVTIRGGIVGTAEAPVIISAVGQAAHPAKGTDTAIKKLTVIGGVEHLRVLAGYDPSGSGVNADASIGSISVGADWHASTVLAGVSPGPDTFEGTADDALLGGGEVHNNGQIVATIGSFAIKGQAFGTTTPGDMFGIVAERIGKAIVGTRAFAFSTTGLQAFYASPTASDAGTEAPAFDFAIREVGATIDSAVGPANLVIDASGREATFTDVDGDAVIIKRSAGSFAAADFVFAPGAGGGQLQLLTVSPAPDSVPVNISVTANPGPGGGNGFVNVGYINASGVNLGQLVVTGDVGRVDAGDGDARRPAVQVFTAQSLGALALETQASGGSLKSHFNGALGKLTLKSDIRGATLEVSDRIGTIAVSNSLIQARISAGADLGSVIIRGQISGTADSPVVISAVGQSHAPTKGIDTAIKSLTVGGGVDYLRILAGYDLNGVGTNADAAVGAITVGGDWRASTVLSGVFSGDDEDEGTIDDRKLAGSGVRDNVLIPTLVSQIASITIKGQALGTTSAGDSFGIVAEQINRAKIGAVTLRFAKGPHSIADFFPLVPTTDFSIGEARVQAP